MSFPMITSGMFPEDIRYLNVDAVVRGKGRDRIKYLDIEGKWILSGKSIPYISSTFNHLEKLNYATGPVFDLIEPAMDAIGMNGWTSDSHVPEAPKKKKPFTIERPPLVEVVEEVSSPREPVPHRSAGYGAAHQKRKLSVPDRSRVSPLAAPIPVVAYDKYATRYSRKDAVTPYGTKWSPRERDDLGYASAVSSGAPSPNVNPGSKDDEFNRAPHRTQAISPLPDREPVHDTPFDDSIIKQAAESGQAELDSIEIKERSYRANYRPRYTPRT